MHRRRWLSIAGVVAAVSLTLLVATCGGGGDDRKQAASTATEVTATSGQTPAQAAPTTTDVVATQPPVPTPVPAEPTATEPPVPTPVERVIVDVPHWEWEMRVSTDTAPAGTVTFNAINEGTIVHNLRLTKTSLAPDALPLDGFMADEAQLDIRAATGDLDAGESEELTAELEPGSYVLFCNIAAHYQSGLYAGFAVG